MPREILCRIFVHNVTAIREFKLIWPSLGSGGSIFKDISIRAVEIPGSIFISISLLAGILVKNHKCLVFTIVVMGVIIVVEGVYACYMDYFHQYTLSMRGLMIVSILVWIRVWFFFVVASLMNYMEVDARVHHVNYLRDSFVLPFRRDLADATEDVMLGVARQPISK